MENASGTVESKTPVKKTPVKKAPVKKAPVKKAVAKEPAASKAKVAKKSEGGISLKHLAKEAKVEPRVARRKLRQAKLSPKGRWSWEAGSPDLAKARAALGL